MKNDICGSCKKPNNECNCAHTGKGAKFDGDKLQWNLLPIKEVEQIVEILTIGAKKYPKDNWKNVPNMDEIYYDALMRHLVAHRKGEVNDPETNKLHLAHAACCLLFLMWSENNKPTTKELMEDILEGKSKSYGNAYHE
jgi:dATP/dGTP diphosphohydrolase, N-terminal